MASHESHGVEKVRDECNAASVRDGDFYLLREVEVELFQAVRRFDPFNSPHEGWAVIREEMDELWEHVKANSGRGSGVSYRSDPSSGDGAPLRHGRV